MPKHGHMICLIQANFILQETTVENLHYAKYSNHIYNISRRIIRFANQIQPHQGGSAKLS